MSTVPDKRYLHKTDRSKKSLPEPDNLQGVLNHMLHHNKFTPAKRVPDKFPSNCRISYQQLCNSLNPNMPFNFPAKRLMDFVECTDPDMFVRFIGKQFGYALVRPKRCVRDLPEEYFAASDLWLAITKFLHRYLAEDGPHKIKKDDLERFFNNVEYLMETLFCLHHAAQDFKRIRKGR